MKYLCIGLAPAIDATITLDHLPADGEVVKNVREEVVPGGKGLNVARWLAVRGADVCCCGFLGADDEALFARELRKYGIGDLLTRVPGGTRRNEMVVTPERAFKLNRPAFPILAERDCLLPDSLADFTVVISGSLPCNFKGDHYARLIRKIRAAGARFIALDASGKALEEGVGAEPDLIKPNTEECSGLVGFRLADAADFRRATEILHEKVPHVVISDGAAGCWFDGVLIKAPEVEVADTTAAGDTLLAEYLYSGDATLAVKAGSAACTMPGGTPPPLDFLARD